MSSITIRLTMAFAIASATLFCVAPFHAAAATPPNRVYVMTNDAASNAVLVFARAATGKLKQIQSVSTGGMGSGGSDDPLHSQGSLTMNSTGTLLLAVNAGSNSVSSFTIGATGLKLVSTVASGGTFPASVAISGNKAYVMNEFGTTPNVTKFQIGAGGTLTPLTGSYVLPGGATSNPGQVLVTPDGKVLVVSEKGTYNIDLFPIAGGTGTATPSNGPGPFGFLFGPNQTLLMTEAINSTVSSYNVIEGTNPSLQIISGSVPDSGGTACWNVLSPDQSTMFVMNSMSRTISTYSVSNTGVLALIQSIAANMGTQNAGIDMALSHDGKFLYVVSSTTGLIAEYSVNGSTLTSLGLLKGLPVSIQGIAAW